MRRAHLDWLIAGCLLCGITWANGTSYAPPTDQTILSPDGKHQLAIIAKTGLHRVSESCNPAKTLWSFKRPVGYDTYYLSSGGTKVAWVAWPFVTTDHFDRPAIVIYSASGTLASFAFRDIGDARPYRKGEIGPIGESWRIWLESIARTGDEIVVSTPKGKKIRIDLAKGAIDPLR